MWRINILWKWGLTHPPCLLLVPREPCRVRSGLPMMVQSGGISWKSMWGSHPYIVTRGHQVLQVPSFEQLSNEEATSSVCLKWVSIKGRVPQSPLPASLPAGFCLQTFTSCLLAQNTNKSHGGHFLVAIETVIIISNLLNSSFFPLQYLATAWCLMGRLHCERRKRAGKRALTASYPALKI